MGVAHPTGVNSGLIEGSAQAQHGGIEQAGGRGRGGHTGSSAEGGNSRILLTEARDGLSDRKEAEAASKQKRDMLKPTGMGDRDRQGPERRNSRAPMLLGTRWDQGEREGCRGMEDEEGGRLQFSCLALTARGPGWRPLWHIPKTNTAKAVLDPRRKQPDLEAFPTFSRATGSCRSIQHSRNVLCRESSCPPPLGGCSRGTSKHLGQRYLRLWGWGCRRSPRWTGRCP